MCVGPLAAVSPIGSLMGGKNPGLPLLSPALALGFALNKKKKSPSTAQPTTTVGTVGSSPSYGY